MSFIEISQTSSSSIIELSDAQKADLDERKKRHLANESPSLTWEEVQQNIRAIKDYTK